MCSEGKTEELISVPQHINIKKYHVFAPMGRFQLECSELSGHQCVVKEEQSIKFLFPSTCSELSGYQ
jgi:hypothetical protein